RRITVATLTRCSRGFVVLPSAAELSLCRLVVRISIHSRERDMTFTNCCARAALAVAAFSLATFARAELPDLQGKQALGPTVSDFELEPGEAAFGDDVVVKGNLAIIGISQARAGVGRAAILVRDASGTWIRRATLEASDFVPVAEFGKAVAISGRR